MRWLQVLTIRLIDGLSIKSAYVPPHMRNMQRAASNPAISAEYVESFSSIIIWLMGILETIGQVPVPRPLLPPAVVVAGIALEADSLIVVGAEEALSVVLVAVEAVVGMPTDGMGLAKPVTGTALARPLILAPTLQRLGSHLGMGLGKMVNILLVAEMSRWRRNCSEK